MTGSPICYPGGKSRAVKHILPFFPVDTKTLISPFMGGGSIEIAMANNGVKVLAFDIFPQLVIFWNAILADAPALRKRVQQFFPLPKERFYSLQKQFQQWDHANEDPIETAAIFFALNKSSFSGTTLSGGRCSGHTGFTQLGIDKIVGFKCPNLSVGCQSFEKTLALPMDATSSVYLDPPYHLKEALYGPKTKKTQEDFDHKLLRDLVAPKQRWVMSYNDNEFIRGLYADFEIREAEWTYAMNKSKKSSEVIILSSDISKGMKAEPESNFLADVISANGYDKEK